MARLRRFVETLWRESRPLTATGIIMLAALVASLAAMGVDHSEILGVPRWLKPAKFAVSTAIYTFTLAWIFTVLPERRRLKAIVGWVVSVVVVLEVFLIDLRAARGVTSLGVLVMVMLGGAGTVTGPALGAFLYEELRGFLLVSETFSHFQLVLAGVLLLTIVLFVPGGLMGWLHRRFARLTGWLE